MKKVVISGNLATLLSNFDYEDNGQPHWPFGIVQIEVNAYCRLLSRCGADPEYHDAVREHSKCGKMGHNFEVACAEEKVVPFNAWDELKAVGWLVQNKSKLKLGHKEQAVLLNSPRFYLVDFKTEKRGLLWQAAPVWRVKSQTGHGQFDYCAWSWQSGMAPCIVG